MEKLVSREETVNKNILAIKTYYDSISTTERMKLMAKMRDIISFYGMTPEIYKQVIAEGKVPYSYPEDKLVNLEGITNAFLFRIKYRKDGEINYSKNLRTTS